MHDIYMATVRNRETFVKTEFQDLGGNDPGITAERDPERHREVAKQLVPAFSPRAMYAQEEHVHRYVDLLVQQLDKHGGTSSNGVDMREVKHSLRISPLLQSDTPTDTVCVVVRLARPGPCRVHGLVPRVQQLEER